MRGPQPRVCHSPSRASESSGSEVGELSGLYPQVGAMESAHGGTLPRRHRPERRAKPKEERGARAQGTGCHGNRGAGLPRDSVPREETRRGSRRTNEEERSAESRTRGPVRTRAWLSDRARGGAGASGGGGAARREELGRARRGEGDTPWSQFPEVSAPLPSSAPWLSCPPRPPGQRCARAAVVEALRSRGGPAGARRGSPPGDAASVAAHPLRARPKQLREEEAAALGARALRSGRRTGAPHSPVRSTRGPAGTMGCAGLWDVPSVPLCPGGGIPGAPRAGSTSCKQSHPG